MGPCLGYFGLLMSFLLDIRMIPEVPFEGLSCTVFMRTTTNIKKIQIQTKLSEFMQAQVKFMLPFCLYLIEIAVTC